jgi:hypothetical protein
MVELRINPGGNRMRAFSNCVAIGILSFSAASQAGVFEDKTDRFTGMRSVAWNTIPAGAESFAVTTAAYYSKGSPAPDGYVFEIITYAKTSQFDGCPYVDWLIDGETAPDLKAKYSSNSAGSATIERFSMSPDRATLTKLASAKLVEFKVCNVESSIGSDDMGGLRKVLEKTK